jgi:putative transposase
VRCINLRTVQDQKFTAGFAEVFRSTGLEIIRTPFRAPQANGVAERFVRTVRSECLDWLLILNAHYLDRVLDVFVAHYNGHRPHRALALRPPRPTRPLTAPASGEARVKRRDRLGGVVHEYVLAA